MSTNPTSRPMRHIRSFVMRTGRMTPAQQRAFDTHWACYGIAYTGTIQNFTAHFGRSAPLVLEIGFGNGEALLWASKHDPVRNYLGIEVHSPGIGRLMNALAVEHRNNVRLYHHDAMDVLEHEIAPASLAEARIWFPDPWHKKRHHKRRMVQPSFISKLAARTIPGGLLHLATDWQPYAEHMLAVMESATEWCNATAPGQYTQRPDWRIITHFERRGLKRGHGVWDLLYYRRHATSGHILP